MFRNHYRCDACGTDWQDEWECACNDECPGCGLGDIEPHESEEIDCQSCQDAIETRLGPCDECGSSDEEQ